MSSVHFLFQKIKSINNASLIFIFLISKLIILREDHLAKLVIDE